MSQAQKKYFNSKDAKNLITIYGFALFPIHGVVDGRCTCGAFPCGKDNRGAGKHPATPNGLIDATKDMDQLRKLWHERKFLNVGIATGAVSGIFVVDIDGAQGEVDISALGKLPQTLTAKTGKGRHLFFKHPGTPVKTRTKVIGDKVDIRGDGGYVAGVGSNHQSGATYEWENPLEDIMPAPQWLLDEVTKDRLHESVLSPPAPMPAQPRASNSSFFHNGWSESDVLDMLSFISADCPHEEWVAIGMALQDEGFPCSIWDSWSQTAKHRYDPSVIAPKWKSFKKGGGVSFGTLVDRAKRSGWMRTSQSSAASWDKVMPALSELNGDKLTTSPTIATKPIESTASIPTLTATTPTNNASRETSATKPLPKFTGLLGRTIEDIIATSQMQQPELATLNTIAALGAVFGRRYASPLDTRTNIYAVGIAVTGAGKDHSRKYLKSLMYKAKLETFLGDDSLVSGAGVLASLTKRPSCIMHLDEFGMLLADIKGKNSGSHMKIAAKILTELYSSSGSIYCGGTYADPKRPPVRLYYPNLCIFGTTPMEKYVEAMDRSVIESGELNRYIILKPAIEFPARLDGVKRIKASQDIVDAWAALVPPFGANNPTDETPPTEVTWQWQDDRIKQLHRFQDLKVREPVTGALWVRYVENVIKIAMIEAISRNQTRPNIESEDFDRAEALVKTSVEFMVMLADTQMFNSQHERDCNRVLEAARRLGSVKVQKMAISNRTRDMDQFTRDKALTALEERGAILIEKEDNGMGGRPRYTVTVL